MVANSCLSQAAEDVAVFPFEAIPTLQQNPRGEMRHTPSCCGCCGSCQERCEIMSMDWFKGKFTGKPPYLMGQSMVSG